MTVLEKFIIRYTLQEPELCNNINRNNINIVTL